MKYDYYDSPIGPLLLAGDEHGLELIGFPEGKGRIEPGADWRRDALPFATVRAQLAEYFAGDRSTFDLPLRPHGTPFQLAVLNALRSIPYGETRSYADIAQQLGRPKAMRAVGAANGRNPLPIVIPCHRVIGADGSLTGFGGGVRVKQYLLDLEQDKPGLF
ncbi:methylated-DNA--[protein]-cysteine S-methyltransferase [Sedimenticola hydrogenitrophicus]|uniref:methylated-DNA--[protein]-cysteine S-methyltransferase n=1 Tax=Sedimenticola hydrogenitrophicus TaxID=2967975 RepID=UPI0021A50289|nr:methylated-DNA--[protein]-cysteine S-methyltransferase [Sedimenticola hydrogenitrophicus]